MDTASVQVLGAYRVELTDELFNEAMESKYGRFKLRGPRLKQAQCVVRAEISHAVLFEVLVSNRDSNFNVRHFCQEYSDQAPYDERFLSDDGSKVVAEGFDVPSGQSLRITFFLHYFDPAKSLKTSYGLVAVPAVEPMPERLRNLAPYVPVD